MERFGIYISYFSFHQSELIRCEAALLNLNKNNCKNLHPDGFLLYSTFRPGARCILCVYIYMYMPKSDAEKVTVKGSHGDSSLQRESDSFRVKRTVS